MDPSTQATIPVIDIAPFINNNSSEDEKNIVAQQVKNACEQIGFFIIKGHGVPNETVDRMYSMAKQFFDLPLETKQKSKGSGCGYLAIGSENLAASYGTDAPPDIKESFNISSRTEQNKWPELPDFKDLTDDYFKEMLHLASIIMRIFAMALEVRENYFDEYIIPPNAVLRFLNYPQLADQPLPNQLRAAPHTDYGTITIVRPNAPGLQALDSDNTWIEINAPPDGFIVNIGDIMKRWTNDKWKSATHQVVNPSEENHASRQSIVFFHNPRDDAEISCLPNCYSDEYPKQHPPITAGEHRKQKSRKSRPNQ